MTTTAVKERPIIFSAPMIHAILEGRKTQTRRVIKNPDWHGYLTGDCPHSKRTECDAEMASHCPFGIPGDALWVREAWKYADWTDDGEPWIEYAAGGRQLCAPGEDWLDRVQDNWAELSSASGSGPASDKRFRSPIHMPRWASRITLEVVGVKVERLQSISEEDAKAEAPPAEPIDSVPSERYRNDFAYLWERIHGPGSWEQNPFVWAITFKRIK